MKRLLILSAGTLFAIAPVTIAPVAITPANAQNNLERFVPRYEPRPQTDSERLQTFQPPPPPPPSDNLLDRAARTYRDAPVRPGFDPHTKSPTIEYQRRF